MTSTTSGHPLPSDTTYSDISYEVSERVATISLDRPEARNGYTLLMSDELEHALRRADADDDVRVVVLTGRGRDFCVGADLSGGGFDVNDGDAPGDGGHWQEPAGRCSRTIHSMLTPVIAAIHGAAVGAGLTITLSCDFRLAAEDTKFGCVFTRRGIFPEGGSAWYLPRLVGLTKASDWMITGRIFGAQEALAAGLLTSVHPAEELQDAALALAADLRDNTAPVSVAVVRQMLAHLSGQATPFGTHEVDSELISNLPTNADAIEGVASFLEKRQPVFPNSVSRDMPEHLPWLSPAEPSR